MKKVVLVVLVSAVFAGLSVRRISAEQATAQGAGNASPSVTNPDAVSREDLRKATAEMKKAVRDAEKKSAEQAAKTRTEAERQHGESLRQSAEAEKKLRAEIAAVTAKQEKAAKAAAKAAEEERKASKKIAIYSMIGVAVFIVVVTGFGVLLARRNAKIVEIPVPYKYPEKDAADILTDPDIPALKEFAVRNGNISKVMFRLTLPNKGTSLDGRQMVCTAELRENLPPLVYFDGDSSPVAWDKRKKRAVLIAAQEQSAAAGSVTQ